MPAKTKRKAKETKRLVMVLMPIVQKPGQKEEKPDPKSKDEKPDDEKDEADEEEQDEEKPDEDEDEEDPGEDAAKLKEALKREKDKTKKARQESIDRRKKNKELAEKNARLEKGLAIIQGKEKPDLDPVEEAQKKANEKMRRAILKGELANIAKDAHSPTELMMIAPNLFADIDVDVENETVDTEALEEAVTSLREKKPYLFATPDTDEENDLEVSKGKSKKPVKPPPGGPRAQANKFTAQWKQLRQQGRTKEAQEFAVKHAKEMQEELKNNPSLV